MALAICPSGSQSTSGVEVWESKLIHLGTCHHVAENVADLHDILIPHIVPELKLGSSGLISKQVLLDLGLESVELRKVVGGSHILVPHPRFSPEDEDPRPALGQVPRVEVLRVLKSLYEFFFKFFIIFR